MRLHRFYVKTPILGDTVDIPEKELVHQWKSVFRYNVGSQVILFDGTGPDYLCMITSLRNLGATVAVIKKMNGNGTPKANLTICLGLIKKDNFELALQKVTEIGASRVIPVLCERSEKKNLNMERLEKIATEASEQSGRSDIPKVEKIHEVQELLSSDLLPNCVVVMDLEGKTLRETIPQTTKEIAVFIGPEGGFSEEELKIFDSYNVSRVTLGEQILRAETAAIAAATLLLL